MHAAWTQLGDIRRANDRLNAARLSLELLRKIHARHLASLPADRAKPIAAVWALVNKHIPPLR